MCSYISDALPPAPPPRPPRNVAQIGAAPRKGHARAPRGCSPAFPHLLPSFESVAPAKHRGGVKWERGEEAASTPRSSSTADNEGRRPPPSHAGCVGLTRVCTGLARPSRTCCRRLNASDNVTVLLLLEQAVQQIHTFLQRRWREANDERRGRLRHHGEAVLVQVRHKRVTDSNARGAQLVVLLQDARGCERGC